MYHIVPLIVNDFDACIAIHFRRLFACYFSFPLRLFHMKFSNRFNNMLKIAKEESEAEIKNDKRTNNYLQIIIQITKDWTMRTQLKTGSNLGWSGGVSCFCFTSGTRRATLVTNLVLSHEWGRVGLWSRQTEHICSHLWHRYSITVNQDMLTTVKLSKWWLQLSH